MTTSKTLGRETLLSDTFDGVNSGSSITSSSFLSTYGRLETDGGNDGAVSFQEVDFSAATNATIAIDASVLTGGFEASGQYGDSVRFELVLEDGTVILLDEFTGNGNTLYGSVTGQRIDRDGESLLWEVPEGVGAASLRIVWISQPPTNA